MKAPSNAVFCPQLKDIQLLVRVKKPENVHFKEIK